MKKQKCAQKGSHAAFNFKLTYMNRRWRQKCEKSFRFVIFQKSMVLIFFSFTVYRQHYRLFPLKDEHKPYIQGVSLTECHPQQYSDIDVPTAEGWLLNSTNT